MAPCPRAADLIPAAARIVEALQAVWRGDLAAGFRGRHDREHPRGTAFNIIPDAVRLEGPRAPSRPRRERRCPRRSSASSWDGVGLRRDGAPALSCQRRHGERRGWRSSSSRQPPGSWARTSDRHAHARRRHGGVSRSGAGLLLLRRLREEGRCGPTTLRGSTSTTGARDRDDRARSGRKGSRPANLAQASRTSARCSGPATCGCSGCSASRTPCTGCE